MNIRKVQKLGTSSLVVTLPKEWAKRVGIEPGDSVYVIEDGAQLRLLPVKKGEPKVFIVCDITGLEAEDAESLTTSLLQMCFERVKIVWRRRNEEAIERVKRVIEKFNSYELKSETPTEILVVLKKKIDSVDINECLREMASMVSRSLAIVEGIVEGNIVYNRALEEVKSIYNSLEKTACKVEEAILCGIGFSERDPIGERFRVLVLALSTLLHSIMRLITSMVLEVAREAARESSREKGGIIIGPLINCIKNLDNALWEITGAITNNSLKRIRVAEERIESLKNSIAGITIYRREGCPNLCLIVSFIELLSEQLLQLSKKTKQILALQKSVRIEEY